MSTSNLIEGMWIVPTFVHPSSNPQQAEYDSWLVQDSDEYLKSPFYTTSDQTIVLRSAPAAVAEVFVWMMCRTALYGETRRVVLYLNGGVIAEDLWQSDGRNCPAEPEVTVKQITIDQGRWNELVQDGYNAYLWFVPVNVPGTCAESFIIARVQYSYLRPAAGGAPQIGLQSYVDTRVSGPGERPDIPHRHQARFCFDPERGCLLVAHESYGGRITYSGAEVTPAVATAAQPGGGGFGSRTSGEHGGVAVRFTCDGNYDRV